MLKFFKFSLLVALGLAIAVFTSCQDNEPKPIENIPLNQTDVGVVINGITWATRNVDQPGTFAEKPESAGMFYQWNRKTAWEATDSVSDWVSGWDRSTPYGLEWKKANDPSPAGWRLPTLAEQRTLYDTEKVTSEWTTQNGVRGRKFTDIATGNSLFFPAVGVIAEWGQMQYIDKLVFFWSSTPHESIESHAYCVSFGEQDEGLGWGYTLRSTGYSVRCVLAE